MPDEFATPKAGNRLRPEFLQPGERENWMRPPFGERLPSPIQKVDLGCGGSQIAECVKIPGKPKGDRHCSESDQHSERRQKIAQFSPLGEIPNLEDQSQSDHEQQNDVRRLNQTRRCKRKAGPNCEEQTWSLRFEYF